MLAEEAAEVGRLFDEVGDMPGLVFLADAGPDGAGQALVDLVKLVRKLVQECQVRFAEQLLDAPFIGEAQGGRAGLSPRLG